MLMLIFINLIVLDYLVFKMYKIKNKLVGSLNYSDLDEDFWKEIK